MGHGNKLSRKKEQAIIALLECPTVLQAADQAKISATTLYKWMAMPDFDAAYRQARRDAKYVGVPQALKSLAVGGDHAAHAVNVQEPVDK